MIKKLLKTLVIIFLSSLIFKIVSAILRYYVYIPLGHGLVLIIVFLFIISAIILIPIIIYNIVRKKADRSKKLGYILLILVLSILIFIATNYFFYDIPVSSEQLSCLKNKGRWPENSHWNTQSCEFPYSDEGRVCSNSSDCESEYCVFDDKEKLKKIKSKCDNSNNFGNCIEQESEKEYGGKLTGHCPKWANWRCWTPNYFVENGRLKYFFCME